MTSNVRVRARSASALVGMLSVAASVHAGGYGSSRIIYVDALALPGGDGASWSRAYRDLQDALADANANSTFPTYSTAQIRIAQGVYRPDRGTHDRSASFVVASGVSLLGGYGGLRSSNPDLRSDRYETVLSGDLLGNDASPFANRDDNAYHVVTRFGGDSALFTASGTTMGASLSRLTIRGGNANGIDERDRRGAGVLGVLSAATLSLADCTIIDNSAASVGSGIFAPLSATVAIYTSRILANAGGLSAISCDGPVVLSSSEVSGNQTVGVRAKILNAWRTSITDNHARTDLDQHGGGVLVWQSAIIDSCTIAGNTGGFGAGIYAEGDSLRIVSTLIAHNVASAYGGGIWSQAADTTADFCSVVANRAAIGAGGILSSAQMQMRASILALNAAPESNQGSFEQLLAYDLQVPGGLGLDSSTLIQYVTPLRTSPAGFIDSTGTSSNPLSWRDKDYRLAPGSTAVDATDLRSTSFGIGSSLSFDADGRQRPINTSCRAYARNDLGAYEADFESCPLPITRLYVRADAPPNGNGRSWATAYRDIADALATPGVRSIVVAQGTYRPDRGMGDPTLSYRIESPLVSLYGGYAGTEPVGTAPSPWANPTIITGDLAGNDTAHPASRFDNTHMLLAVDLPPTGLDQPRPDRTIISGLRFRSAHAPASADRDTSALLVREANALIDNCEFSFNASEITRGRSGSIPASGGGAIRVAGLSLIELRSDRFIGNSASGSGGAVCVAGGQIFAITDSEWTGNTSRTSGGALSGPFAIVDRCSFVANSVFDSEDAYGGAVELSLAYIQNSRFSGNLASGGFVGGGAVSARGRYVNCAFNDNRVVGSVAHGGAISGDIVHVVNCTLYDNLSSDTIGSGTGSGTAIVTYSHTEPSLIRNSVVYNATPLTPVQPVFRNTQSYALFQVRNSIVSGPIPPGAVSVSNADPRLNNPSGPDGVRGTADDDLRPRSDSPLIDAGDPNLFLDYSFETDLSGKPRHVDIPGVPGNPGPIDIGAYEYQLTASCRVDFNANGRSDIDDIFTYLAAWFRQEPSTNFDTSPAITLDDLFIFLSAWFAGC